MGENTGRKLPNQYANCNYLRRAELTSGVARTIVQETTPDLDYGDAFPSKSKKKRKTM